MKYEFAFKEFPKNVFNYEQRLKVTQYSSKLIIKLHWELINH